MEIKTNGALNFLKEQKQAMEQARATKKERATTKNYSPNEYGFYTMQQCYILNNMLSKGANVDANGLFNYTNKDGETKSHHITNITAYNQSCKYYETLRGLGVKNCVELLKWDDTKIELIRKIGGEYYKTTITDKNIIDEHYNGAKELLQFVKV